MWELPHNEHWEIPPRNESDRDTRQIKFPQVKPEHRGEEYWHKCMVTREALLERTQGWGYGSNHQLEMYEAHDPVRFISIILFDDWHSRERIAPVVNVALVMNADDQMLQMLAAGA